MVYFGFRKFGAPPMFFFQICAIFIQIYAIFFFSLEGYNLILEVCEKKSRIPHVTRAWQSSNKEWPISLQNRPKKGVFVRKNPHFREFWKIKGDIDHGFEKHPRSQIFMKIGAIKVSQEFTKETWFFQKIDFLVFSMKYELNMVLIGQNFILN